MSKLLVITDSPNHVEVFFLERAAESLAGLGLSVNTARWRVRLMGNVVDGSNCMVTLENPITRHAIAFEYRWNKAGEWSLIGTRIWL